MTAPGTPGDHAPALDGMRVIEATQGVGGPFAAMMLSDMGAAVTKVEPPAGDGMRGTPAFHVLNRGKQSIALDLETVAGREHLRGLLATADVFLHDWMPGEAERRGFDAASLHAMNPRLVIGHLPAYGTRGPYADLPYDEGMMQAIAGVQDAQYRCEDPPVFVNLPVAGYAQGIMAANATVATLLARARSGLGDAFEISGVAALFVMETIAYLRGPGVMRLAGHADPRGPIPTYRLVRGTDDWLFAGALTPPFWASMAVAAGLEACLVDEKFAGAPMGIANMDDRRELARRVDEAFSHRSRDEWLRILEEANVPRAPALTREEFASDPGIAHNNMLVDVDDPALGRTRQMNVPVTLHDTPGRVPGPAPALNAHASSLDALPSAAASVSASGGDGRAFDGKPPLDGVTVIDLSGFIAGANCPAMLADMGANVIKVESPDGDGWRTSGLAFLGSNRGKRGIVIDLKQPEGRELLLDLAARADVVMDNFRAGVMERLGIGWETLRARNPRLVHCSVTGFGPTGPYAHLPGFDPLFQARSGLMRAQGEPGGEPVYLQVPVCDYMTALTACFGIITALVARERTGRGQRVETCLLNSALTSQAGEFIFYEGRPPDPPGGRDLRGLHALYRIYEAADGSIMLSCSTPEHAARLADAIDVALPAGDPLSHETKGALAGEIAALIATQTRAHWVDAFRRAGVPAAPCLRVDELFDDEHLCANDLWWESDHPRWGRIRQPGATVRWHARPMRIDRRAPLLGEHTLEVLREFGIDGARIDSLIESATVVQRADQ